MNSDYSDFNMAYLIFGGFTFIVSLAIAIILNLILVLVGAIESSGANILVIMSIFCGIPMLLLLVHFLLNRFIWEPKKRSA